METYGGELPQEGRGQPAGAPGAAARGFSRCASADELATPPQVYEAVEKEYPEDLECLTYLQVSFCVCLCLSVSVWVGGWV